jgi:hypothetical protein
MTSIASESLQPLETFPDDDQSPIWNYVTDSLNNFSHQFKDINEFSVRAPLALTLVSELRNNSMASSRNKSPLARQLKPKTQLDAIEWLAWNNLWFYHAPEQIMLPGTDSWLNVRQAEFLAADRLFNDIQGYHISSVENPEPAYEELLDIFHMARQILNNPTGATAVEKKVDRVALAKTLSVYQTANTLRSGGYSQTRRSTLQEKDKGIDVIVPLGKSFQRDFAIRMQPGCQQLGRLEAEATSRLLYVSYPYNIVQEHPFTMRHEDKLVVLMGAREMETRSLASKFGAEALHAA